MQIALIDGEPAHMERMRQALQLPLPGQEGRTVLRSIGSVQALHALHHQTVDAMVVDWAMVRDFGGRLPTLALPAGCGRAPALVLLPEALAEGELKRALGLEAEDYAFKPIATAELRWRIARLARPRVEADRQYGDWRLQPATHSVLVREHGPAAALRRVVLTECEFRLLARLMRELDRTVPREHLIAAAIAPWASTGSRSLDTHVYRLRRKLPMDGSHGFLLQGIYRVGYRLCATTARAGIGASGG
ncbi:response regulator transcription factor [uncultured Pseudacidovorax sp.]|uniref:response regulator transcription factor n=1 Tax=uncultured Pseudacidovorax sp. TaxID=679313 RepID=UPI0025D0479E|nr:response regulator transcription factor [uncultured Pseudacidovorax sp.]